MSAGRAHQLVAGALVAMAAMRALQVSELQICPWALREGIIFRRLDVLDGHAFEPDDSDEPHARRAGSAGCAAGPGAAQRSA